MWDLGYCIGRFLYMALGMKIGSHRRHSCMDSLVSLHVETP